MNQKFVVSLLIISLLTVSIASLSVIGSLTSEVKEYKDRAYDLGKIVVRETNKVYDQKRLIEELYEDVHDLGQIVVRETNRVYDLQRLN